VLDYPFTMFSAFVGACHRREASAFKRACIAARTGMIEGSDFAEFLRGFDGD
jgi:hypothetical protein